VKAITLWQPWATLWLLDGPREKEYETRSWSTYHRGRLMVHASKAVNADVKAALKSRIFLDALARHELTPDDLQYGAVIGHVELMGCYRMKATQRISDTERAFGLWEEGRWAWRGAQPTLIDPVPCKGDQGLWEFQP
jgi:hypothetical protein